MALLYVTLGRAGGRNTAMLGGRPGDRQAMAAAETVGNKVHAHVSAFDFISVALATELAVLLIVVSWVATGEVTFTGSGRG